MPTLNCGRRRAVRAILSALAGGGLTAAGLGGPLASSALGGTETTATTTAAETAGSSQSEGSQQTGTSTTPSTTPTQTTTTPATTPTETTSTPSTTPSATTPTATTPSTTAPGSAAQGTPSSGGAAPTTTSPHASAPAPPSAEAPTVVLKRKQRTTSGASPRSSKKTTSTTGGKRAPSKKSAKRASGPDNVAASPQSIAAEAGLLAAMLASSEASTEALSFYRIPLFLLPIYKAAAVQYGVPWQILAAINEIETDYGNDLSVSTAGAVGWMQFMPSTWLQYGVDALNAGYADPYNPVDAVFAAARYLRAAGAATNLRAAIFSYNHSEEYVESVLLRARLISSYPKDVIATLTGLIDGRLPVTGKQLAWTPVPTPRSSSSATAGASAPATSPDPTPPLSPAAAAAAATAKAAHAHPLQLVELLSAPNASVVAVQDGRVMRIGESRKLGKYLVLRDVYGDVFTYAGLGSIAPTYVLPKAQAVQVKSPVVEAASTPGPAPSQAASAGTQPPLTLQVKTPTPNAASAGQVSIQSSQQEAMPAGMDQPRVYAHPGNPDAHAAAAADAARKARISNAGRAQPLRPGAVVATGTVLGRVSMPPGARDGHMRFAIRPAGDPDTVDPGPVLANWAQLQKALHPHGAKAADPLLGATASDVFLLSKAQLERAVLSDPGIVLDACARREVAAGAVDDRVLAVLAFLSRSGLEPTVGALRCNRRQYAPAASPAAGYTAEEVDITAVNGTPIAGHQGPETITELTIRTLLNLPAKFVPHEIVSLMRFPGAPATHANAADWNRIHLEFRPPTPATPTPAAAATAAHSAGAGPTAPAPNVASTNALSAAQWDQLMERVGALPMPTVPTKPSSAAIPDPKRP
ncbi:MAG TPA: lytic murein transglycosylase [Solirubrobacteraceae bacterium]|nr:lytic murein transglycosylase [Solirubrobacteraceae bacterium]